MGNLKKIINRSIKTPESLETYRETIKIAYDIALKTLRSRYSEYGVQAGKTHFSDVWIRDCCFASMGSIVVEDLQQVKLSLASICTYMSDTGQVPLRIGEKVFLLKYLGLSSSKKKPVGVFSEDKYVSVVTDSNSLFIILFSEYIRKSKDYDFLKEHYQKLRKAMEWNLLKTGHDMLIEEGPFSGWADSIKKRGMVLYTNILYCEALYQLSFLARKCGEKHDGEAYSILGLKVKKSINNVFWNGTYYVDWIGFKKEHYFSSDGNLLAIVFGIATPDQARKIQTYIEDHKIDQDFCISTSYPKYQMEHIYKPFYLFRMQDYHNGLKWLWVGCVDVIAKFRTGLKDNAMRQLHKLAQKIIEHDGVFEVYEREGKPLKRLFYRSEKEFAWSSGLFLWACHEIIDPLNPEALKVVAPAT